MHFGSTPTFYPMSILGDDGLPYKTQITTVGKVEIGRVSHIEEPPEEAIPQVHINRNEVALQQRKDILAPDPFEAGRRKVDVRDRFINASRIRITPLGFGPFRENRVGLPEGFGPQSVPISTNLLPDQPELTRPIQRLGDSGEDTLQLHKVMEARGNVHHIESPQLTVQTICISEYTINSDIVWHARSRRLQKPLMNIEKTKLHWHSSGLKEPALCSGLASTEREHSDGTPRIGSMHFAEPIDKVRRPDREQCVKQSM